MFFFCFSSLSFIVVLKNQLLTVCEAVGAVNPCTLMVIKSTLLTLPCQRHVATRVLSGGPRGPPGAVLRGLGTRLYFTM